MLRRLGGFAFSAMILLFDGCSYSDSTRIDDRSYFPLRVGSYQIYQVSESNIQHVSCSNTTIPVKNYDLKVLIYDSAKNVEGSYTYYIHRFTRPDSTQTWTALDTWSARLTTNQVIVNEGNTPYVKLNFPLVNNSKWDSNQYNTLGVEYDTLKYLGQPFQLSNGKKYSTTLTIGQNDNRDFFVYQDKRFEVYAPAIGLIYKEITQLTYFQDPCYGQQKVKTGLIYTQSLKSSGHE